MAQITAAMVKSLREKTGAGMMDCKKALAETDGDVDAAVDWLRTKGLSQAAKKSGRAAAEGLVGLAVDGTRGALVEVNAETDFVARNEQFQGFVETVAGLALAEGGDMDGLKDKPYPGSERTLGDELTHLIATIGENMELRRAVRVEVAQGVIGAYVHGAVKAGTLGKIGVLVALEGDAAEDKMQDLAKHIAMHVAATNPASLDVADLDPELVEREKQVQRDKAADSGKPAEIIEKMIEGRMRKFYEEVCLMKQISVVDGETKIEKLIEQAAKDAGASIMLKAYVRYELGEGKEKKEDDFAAEVAAAAAGS
ncbi:translation elongation factor Ts [Rhodothalassium salexigens]|uniref:translation elongation factor Ts n=1 Tax=Rhodothalassium salexigens TaxID=1086 RepID=UPI0019128EB7|nr:translation elongation factor Ts [Rhodothalassium salexigens]MBK5922115.1 translation elongation factor Ts [Rhodothalassium salexigens]